MARVGVSGRIPLLASPQGGVAASSRKCREATEADADGVVFHTCSIGKPPRPRDQRRLRDICLIARPPLLAVMQGGDYALLQLLDLLQFVHTFWSPWLKLFRRYAAVRR